MGTIPERPMSSSSSSVREIDPLLKGLSEKKQSFRQNVMSLAAELKEVQTRLALQEQCFVKETQTRQQAEAKAKGLEEEASRLHKTLEERNKQLLASASNAEKYLKELDDLSSQLIVTKSTANASAASAQSAQMKCLALLKNLDEKNSSLKQHEDRVKGLSKQLDKLQKDLQAREYSQKQLRDEVQSVERDVMEAVAKAGGSKHGELRKVLDEVSLEKLDKMNRLLAEKDEEIAKLTDEIKFLSAHEELKTEELETQLETHRKADQQLKKRVLKLECFLQEARSQTRKVQRIGERRDEEIKELKDQLAIRQQAETKSCLKQNFWESHGFKIFVSMSMLLLVVLSRR